LQLPNWFDCVRLGVPYLSRMNDNWPGDREIWKFFLPTFVVDFLIGPFPDEVGWPLVAAKWCGLGFVAAQLVDAPLSVPLSLVIVGVVTVLLASHPPG
jgi:hypothetical protein